MKEPREEYMMEPRDKYKKKKSEEISGRIPENSREDYRWSPKKISEGIPGKPMMKCRNLRKNSNGNGLINEAITE